jgi:hypothetical protein
LQCRSKKSLRPKPVRCIALTLDRFGSIGQGSGIGVEPNDHVAIISRWETDANHFRKEAAIVIWVGEAIFTIGAMIFGHWDAPRGGCSRRCQEISLPFTPLRTARKTGPTRPKIKGE